MPNRDEMKKNAGDAAQQAKHKAGQFAHDNKDKFAGMLGKLGAKIDEKTQGKYHDKIGKAQDAALKGADKLAEQRPGASGAGTDQPGATGQTGPTDDQVPPIDPNQGPGQNPPSGV